MMSAPPAVIDHWPILLLAFSTAVNSALLAFSLVLNRRRFDEISSEITRIESVLLGRFTLPIATYIGKIDCGAVEDSKGFHSQGPVSDVAAVPLGRDNEKNGAPGTAVFVELRLACRSLDAEGRPLAEG